jgi:hypothetical protein
MYSGSLGTTVAYATGAAIRLHAPTYRMAVTT